MHCGIRGPSRYLGQYLSYSHVRPSAWVLGCSGLTPSSIIENGIAIIVGSAPAFSNFLVRFMGDTKVWGAVRTALRSTRTFGGRNGPGSSESSRDHVAQINLWTIGSRGTRECSQHMNALDRADSQSLGTDIAGRYDILDDDQLMRPDKVHLEQSARHIMGKKPHESSREGGSTDQLV
jgi:hypothetical protein